MTIFGGMPQQHALFRDNAPGLARGIKSFFGEKQNIPH